MKLKKFNFKNNELFNKYELSNFNRKLLIYLYELKNKYELKSINFILDNENNLYFYLNDNDKILFYNYNFLNIELLYYLDKNKLHYKSNKFNLYYDIDIKLVNINSIDINLNECIKVYLNSNYKYIIKEYLKKSLKNEI